VNESGSSSEMQVVFHMSKVAGKKESLVEIGPKIRNLIHFVMT